MKGREVRGDLEGFLGGEVVLMWGVLFDIRGF
jgi:hypothetical protein